MRKLSRRICLISSNLPHSLEGWATYSPIYTATTYIQQYNMYVWVMMWHQQQQHHAAATNNCASYWTVTTPSISMTSPCAFRAASLSSTSKNGIFFRAEIVASVRMIRLKFNFELIFPVDRQSF